MTLKDYSVWAARPTSYDAQTPKQDPKSPHIILYLDDGTNPTTSSSGSGTTEDQPQADINVKSTDKDARLVYWVVNNFTHPITSELAKLPLGVHSLTATTSSGQKGLALDYQRTEPALFDDSSGQLLEPSGADGNDILDKLEPILDAAIKQKAEVYIFGQAYNDSSSSSNGGGDRGIHDVHMNQGNPTTGGFENDVYSDGALIVHFPDDGHFEAVFLAFGSQALPTDDETGDPVEGAVPFDQKLAGEGGSAGESNGGNRDDEKQAGEHDSEHGHKHHHGIIRA